MHRPSSASAATPPPARLPAWRRYLGPGLEAFRTYWPIFIGIQSAAACFVTAYYLSPEVQVVARQLGELKVQGGLLASALATVISGGVIPELLKWRLRPAHIAPPSRGEILHQWSFFALAGMEVDLFYRLQAHMFGDSPAWDVILRKLLVDQLIFTPLIALPFLVTWFMWREHGYRPLQTLRAWSWGIYRDRVLPLWATSATYWPVIVTFMYSLPKDLQFVLFLFCNAAWSLILIYIARRQTRAT